MSRMTFPLNRHKRVGWHLRPGRLATCNELGQVAGTCPYQRQGNNARETRGEVVGMDVLLVEDEALIREMLAEGLADAGLEVTEVPSAEAALGAAVTAEEAGQPPAVLVTDVNLGNGMDGLALAAEVRRRWPGVGVVVMTGNPANLSGRPPEPREVCLLKPFGPPRLAAAVHELMSCSRR